uniref:Uncharacterized protein n=1 Tax=Vespula pensylvanica TaxID=30213 RepID=A0A834P9P7_VESPE|nr:hypothetical protein H0235_002460 [Vespula pensylvanica]
MADNKACESLVNRPLQASRGVGPDVPTILARSLVAFWTAWSKHCSENEKIVHIDRMERSGDKGAVGVEGEEE